MRTSSFSGCSAGTIIPARLGSASWIITCSLLRLLRISCKLLPNLRIVVFNNGGGQIFSRLPGLYCSEAAPELIAAAHGYSLQHIAAAFGLEYHAAHNLAEADEAIKAMLASSGKAQLTEIFTRSADNEEARIKYQEMINALVNE